MLTELDKNIVLFAALRIYSCTYTRNCTLIADIEHEERALGDFTYCIGGEPVASALLTDDNDKESRKVMYYQHRKTIRYCHIYGDDSSNSKIKIDNFTFFHYLNSLPGVLCEKDEFNRYTGLVRIVDSKWHESVIEKLYDFDVDNTLYSIGFGNKKLDEDFFKSLKTSLEFKN